MKSIPSGETCWVGDVLILAEGYGTGETLQQVAQTYPPASMPPVEVVESSGGLVPGDEGSSPATTP